MAFINQDVFSSVEFWLFQGWVGGRVGWWKDGLVLILMNALAEKGDSYSLDHPNRVQT